MDSIYTQLFLQMAARIWARRLRHGGGFGAFWPQQEFPIAILFAICHMWVVAVVHRSVASDGGKAPRAPDFKLRRLEESRQSGSESLHTPHPCEMIDVGPSVGLQGESKLFSHAW